MKKTPSPMSLNNKTGWRLVDPSPSSPLAEIVSVASRAEALIARSRSPLLRTDFLRLFGVVTILSGLEYHYVNQLKALSALKIPPGQGFSAVRHETVAWLNRVGQLYYFCISRFARDNLPQANIPTIEAVLPFRHKHGAHRSFDKPLKGDSDHLQQGQAYMLSDLSGSLWSPRPGFERAGNVWPMHATHFAKFQLRPDEGNHIELVLERQHPIVVLEGYTVLEAVLNSPSNQGDA